MVVSVTNPATPPVAKTAPPLGGGPALGLQGKSPLEAAFGVSRPQSVGLTAAATAESTRQYVSMSASPAGDVFARTAQPSKPYFSAQSVRAQFSSFALQALQQQRQQAFKSIAKTANLQRPMFGKQGAGTLGQAAPTGTAAKAPSILYHFAADNAASPQQAPYNIGVRVQSVASAPQFGKQANTTADKLAYQVEPMVYRQYDMPATQSTGLGANRLNNVPHMLHDSVPTQANAVQFASGEVRMMADLPAAPAETTSPLMKTVGKYTQKAIQFAGKHMPAIQRWVGYDTASQTVRFGKVEVPLQQFSARLGDTGEAVAATPLRLMKTDAGYATLHTPLAFGSSATQSTLAPSTHTRLSQSRTHVEQLASQLGNGAYFGTHFMRQPAATQMTTAAAPVPAKALGVNPFATIGFSSTA